MNIVSKFPGPAYRIHTRRLVIRCWNPADAQLVHAPFDVSLEHLCNWVPWHQKEADDLQVRIERLRRFRSEFDLGRQLLYGVFNCQENTVLGNCGLQMGVGSGTRVIVCWIYKDFVNQGMATEVVSALIKVGFEVDKVKRLEMHADPQNNRSIAVPGKLGFVHEATLRKCDQTLAGEMRDTMIWSLLDEDYAQSPAVEAQIEAFDVLGRRIL